MEKVTPRILVALALLLIVPGLLGNGRNDTIRCSLINLIATPEKYDGRRVQTTGVATIGFETNFLYLSLEDAHDTVMENGVGLSFKGSKISDSDRKKLLHMRRVLVSGVFHRNPVNDGLGAGGISDIDQIFALKDVKVE